MNKKILLLIAILLIWTSAFSSFRGSFNFKLSYLDINNKSITNVDGYYKDETYEAGMVFSGNQKMFDVDGVLRLKYNDNDPIQLDITGTNIKIKQSNRKIILGDFFPKHGELSFNNQKFTGIGYIQKNKLIDFNLYYGRTQEPNEPDAQSTYARYEQYTLGADVGIKPNKDLKIDLIALTGEDKTGSIDTGTPSVAIKNDLYGLKLNYFFKDNLKFIAQYSKSGYDNDKRDTVAKLKDNASKAELILNQKDFSIIAGYKKIEPNFYSTANPYISTDRKSIYAKNIFHIKPKNIKYKLNLEKYNDNLDGNKTSGKTTSYEIKNILEHKISKILKNVYTLKYRTQENKLTGSNKVENKKLDLKFKNYNQFKWGDFYNAGISYTNYKDKVSAGNNYDAFVLSFVYRKKPEINKLKWFFSATDTRYDFDNGTKTVNDYAGINFSNNFYQNKINSILALGYRKSETKSSTQNQKDTDFTIDFNFRYNVSVTSFLKFLFKSHDYNYHDTTGAYKSNFYSLEFTKIF